MNSKQLNLFSTPIAYLNTDLEDTLNEIITLQNSQNEIQNVIDVKLIELESKLEMTYDLALESTSKVRIGSGYWYLHSPIIIAALVVTLIAIILIILNQIGVKVNYTSSLIWPITVAIFAWGAIFNTSNKQYSDYQEGKDAMLLVKMTELLNKTLAESRAQFEKDFARETKAREKHEAEATKAREKHEAEATKAREKHEAEANEKLAKQNAILDAMLAKIQGLEK